jgi:hypothetical protein
VEALFEITSQTPKQNLPCTRRPEVKGEQCGSLMKIDGIPPSTSWELNLNLWVDFGLLG